MKDKPIPEGYEEIRVGDQKRIVKTQPLLSRAVREIAEKNNCSQDDVAYIIGKDVKILRNKLYRGVFSIQDIVLIGDMFGYRLSLSNEEHEFTFTPADICDSEALERLNGYKKHRRSMELKQLSQTSDEAILEYIKSNPEPFKEHIEQILRELTNSPKK